MVKYGFTLKNSEYIDEIKSRCDVFEHKSGAKLVNIKNSDENKVFYIGFRTPPENDKGIPHIIEHSVLCGSEKFRVKDPFNELSKSSLNTYLNAVTFKDKTVYPVASTNEKDFMNLIEVYLDAVFAPLIKEKKEIFMQEGIHIHKEKGQEGCFKGVVYNEMKGSYSDPERILDGYIFRTTFPTDYYRYDSGGVPEDIRKLTYEEFIDFYNRHYQPSNSYIYIYGNGNAEKYMELIDKEYLSKYEKNELDLPVPSGNAEVKKRFCRGTYPCKEDNGRLSYFTLNYITGKATDYERCMALDILCYLLAGSSSSPLTAAIIKEDICDNLSCWADDSIYNVLFTIMAENADSERIDDFEKIVKTTLKGIVEKGFDEKLIDSTLNAFEFSMREADYGSTPKGLVYGFNMASIWLNGGNPIDAFRFIEVFGKIKEKARKGYFENLIAEMINDKGILVAIDPEDNGRDDSETEEIKKIYAEISDDEKSKIEEATEKLLKYQSEPEKSEDIAKIPFIGIEEIGRDVSFDGCEEENGIITTLMDTDGISYLRLMFDTASIPQEKLPMLGIFNILVGESKAGEYSYERLPIEINMCMGSLDTGFNAYKISGDESYRVYDINARFLTVNTEKAFDLTEKIVFETLFEDKDDIKKILQEAKSGFESSLINSGHETALHRSLSYISKAVYFCDRTNSVDLYKLICEILSDYDGKFEYLKGEMKAMAASIFTKENMRAYIAAEKDGAEKAKIRIETIRNKLPKGNSEKYAIALPEVKREAFTADGMVVYNAKAANYVGLGYKYSGSMDVMKTIVNREYLWNAVRVKGGAYGAGMGITRNGNVFMYSYRDPNISYTYNCYNGAGEFLKNFNCGKKLLDRYIIGTVSVLDRPKSTAARAKEALTRYILGIDRDTLLRERAEILDTDIEKIKQYTKLFDELGKLDYICTVGSRSLIAKTDTNFERVVPLIK